MNRTDRIQFSKNGAFILGSVFLSLMLAVGCSITAVRPSQEMSNMDVAIRAAKEVNADVLAPELYRSAIEKSTSAKREYRFKNFTEAKAYANQARRFAEQAEFESIRNGGRREALPSDPLAEPSYAVEPIATPSPDASPSSSTKNPATAAPTPSR